jgi:heme exporter protein B
MIAIMAAIIRRDLLIGRRGLSDSLAGIGYYAVIIALVPLALGPDPVVLKFIGSAMLWVAVLVASLPQMERFFSREIADGSLDHLVLTPLPLPIVVLAKVVAGWLLIGLPLVLMTPVLGLMLGLPLTAMPVIILAVLIGSIGLMLLGSTAAAVVIGARRASILTAVVTLPLTMPILIFGTAACRAAIEGMPVFSHMALLGATTLILLAVTPFATAGGLRIAAE